MAMEVAIRLELKAAIIIIMQGRLWLLVLVERLWVLLPCITITERKMVAQHLRSDTAPIKVV